MDAPEDLGILRDLKITTYLHFEHRKFWEIKFEGHSLETVIRYGKLVGNDEEEPSSVQVFRLTHDNLGEGFQYIQTHINLKKEKGYELLVKDTEDGSQRDSKPKKLVLSTADEIRALMDDSDDLSQYDPKPINLSPVAEEKSLKRKSEESLMPDKLKQMHKTEPENQVKPTTYVSMNDKNKNRDLMEIEEKKKTDILVKKQGSTEFKNRALQPTTGNDSDHINFKGAFMTKQTPDRILFCKVQVLKSLLKTENGIFKDPRSVTCQYRIYENKKKAVDKAHDEIKERLAQGYILNDEHFTFDFTESEASHKLGLVNKLPKSTPTSPVRATAYSPIDPKRQSGTKDIDRTQEIESAKEDLEESDIESEQLSFDLNKHRENELKEKPRIKRTQTRVRSASPERGKFDTRIEQDLQEESPLGDPVVGVYDSLQMPKKWTRQNPSGWYYHRKIEGVRCFWDGNFLWSKKGREYVAPNFFTEFFPKSPLDGELYLDKTSAVSSTKLQSILLKKKPKDEDWNEIKFLVYDAPELKLPFKRRLDKMKKVFANNISPYIVLCEYEICESKKELNQIKDEVEKEGGEGLLIRDPQGFYEKGKSSSVLDVVTFHDDDAVVIGHEEGKNEKETGGLRVKNNFGIEFTISSGLTKQLKKNPPKIGSKIRYKYKSTNDEGVPKHPTLLRDNDDDDDD